MSLPLTGFVADEVRNDKPLGQPLHGPSMQSSQKRARTQSPLPGGRGCQPASVSAHFRKRLIKQAVVPHDTNHYAYDTYDARDASAGAGRACQPRLLVG